MSIAFMNNMNISSATMPEFDVTQRISSKPDLTYRERASYGESGFGSLINNETGSANRSSSPYTHSKINPRDNKSNSVGKRTERTNNDHDTNLDTKDNGNADAVSKPEEETRNNKKADTQNYNDKADSTKTDQADSDDHPGLKTGPQNGMGTGALLFNLFEAVVTANADIINADSDLSPVDKDNTKINKGGVDGETGQAENQPGVEAGSQNGLNIGALLFDLINGTDKVNTDKPDGGGTGFRIGSVINKSGAVTKGDAEQSENSPGVSETGNGLKTGDFLSDILGDAVSKHENALKAGDVLSDLLKGPVLKSESSSETSGSVNSESAKVNIAELSPVEAGTEGGLKTGDQMFAKSEMVDKTPVNGRGSEENSIEGRNDENKLKSGDTAHTDLFIHREIVEGGDKKTDAKSNHFNVTQSREDALYLNSPGKDSIRETLIQGMSPEVATHVNAEHSLKGTSFDAAKQVNIDSEVDNVHLVNSSNITREGDKAGESIFSGSTARPAGLHELVDKIVYVVRGNSKLGVAVEHENLGKLNINLSMEKGVVNVHIDATDKVTREYLENNIQQIIDSLSKNGVSVGGFSVALKEHSDNPAKTFTMDNGQKRKISAEPVSVKSRRGLVNIFA
jgi:hypothetical protein